MVVEGLRFEARLKLRVLKEFCPEIIVKARRVDGAIIIGVAVIGLDRESTQVARKGDYVLRSHDRRFMICSPDDMERLWEKEE